MSLDTTKKTQAEQLMEDLPRSAVKTRPGGGKALSYVDGHYVISRLLQIFGPAGYEVRLLDGPTQVQGSGKPEYLAKVRLTVLVDGNAVGHEDIGYGSGDHEKAPKEAVTDALKRCARYLGNSMGLALYDKEQANVVDDTPAGKAKRKGAKPSDIMVAISEAKTHDQLQGLYDAVKALRNKEAQPDPTKDEPYHSTTVAFKQRWESIGGTSQ